MRTNELRGFRLWWKQRSIQAFVLFGLTFILVFNYAPMIGILMSFKDYKITSGIKGIFTSRWVGLKYYQEFFTDLDSDQIIVNTLILSVIKLIFTFPLPILLALVLNEVRVLSIKKVVQTVSYLPYFISWVIVVGFCRIFLSTTGVVNSLLQSAGAIESPIPFLTGAQYFRGICVFTACWKDMGWWAILFLAGIAGVDSQLYESAQIDGAGRLSRIYHITLPAIRGTIVVVLIMALGNLMGGGLSGSNFEQCYLLGNSANSATSEIIQTYVMKMGLAKARYSYATAMGLFQSVISVTLVVISNFAARRLTGDSLF